MRNCSQCNYIYSRFFSIFKLFPICSVQRNLQARWPKNLSVRHLELRGFGSPSDIENLSSIECELDLNMDCVAAEQMYQLTERIGRLVKSLTIGSISAVKNEDHSEIILERILAACPNLEHFTFKICREVVLDDRYILEPSDFKNYQT
jgi:hypothetical protein